ncbi:sporulation protein YunB [Paenibacillus sp. Marseille-Q4541]|uniref:sporulation protein YunB n=1 Tax=Paenibacillus sp. Marseille-Q4541 TaxID=2831522 RepID=UPI001BA5121E|nr:sporulation protein YunB [Paenibacillus sp. Marseille-Q4541]
MAFKRSRWRKKQRPKTGGHWKKWALIIVLVVVILTVQTAAYMERNLKPPIMHLAKIRVKQLATEAINKAITSQIAGGNPSNDLIEWKTDSKGKISGFILNYDEHMRITSNALSVVQSTLQDMKAFKDHIPLGQALGSPLLSSFGPQVPIRIEPQGAVKVDLSTRQQNAGINMILVEVYIHIIAEVAVVVPLDMEPEVVDTELPISYLLVVGDVPMYYYDNQGRPVGENGASAPNIALPSVPSGTGSPNTGVTTPDVGTTVPKEDGGSNLYLEEPAPLLPTGNE